MTVIGQAKAFCGWGVKGVLRWDTVGPERVGAVQAVIRDQIEAIFGASRP
jgi:hypothetical protein